MSPRRGSLTSAAKLPRIVEPMLATLTGLPQDDGWRYEFKWDGVRAIVFVEGGRVRLQSRRLRDVTHEYPELQGLARAVEEPAILDGEIVALDEKGIPRFERLQQRFGLTAARDIEARMGAVPAVFLAYDLLWSGAASLMARPYEERRERLEALGLAGDHWTMPPSYDAAGSAMLDLSRERGLEGIVAKRVGSTYQAGARSRDWRKVKNRNRQEFVIGGYTAGEGAREGTFGALLLGLYEDGRLVYAGKVGTGYTETVLRDLLGRLRPLERAKSPFQRGDPPRARWVAPQLVAEIEFAEFTVEGLVRAGAFKGLRFDKDPKAVVRERPSGESKEER